MLPRSRSARTGAALLATSLALAVGAVPAGAAPALDGTFPLPGAPQRLAAGPDGNVWATIGAGGDVARVTPAGVVTAFDLPDVANPNGIVAGPDGRLWVTQNGGVASFDPADPTVGVVATPIAAVADPRAIATGPGGVLWTASNDKLVRIPAAAPATATATTITGASARDVAVAPDGRVWVASFSEPQLVRTDAAGANPTPVATRPTAGLQGIAAAPDGRIAFADPTGQPHQVGLLAPGAATATTVDLPATDPFGIVHGPDGAFWTAQFAGESVSRIAADGTISKVSFPAGSGPRSLTAGPAGSNALWVGLQGMGKEAVARISGVVAPAPPAGGGGGGTPGGGAPGTGTPPPTTTAARVTGLRVTPARFVPGRARRAARRGRPAVGTTFRVRVSSATQVRLVVERAVLGRRRSGRCRPSTRALRRAGAPTCVRRWRTATTLRRELPAGSSRIAFLGRAKGRALPAGRYHVRALATGASTGPVAGFRIG